MVFGCGVPKERPKPIPTLPTSSLEFLDHKDPLKLMIEAAIITHKAEEAILNEIKPGMYERDLKTIIDREYKEHGSTGLAFDHIVGSGPNSTDLHYAGDSRQLQASELVVVDIGSMYYGWCSDITRTFSTSKKYTDRQKEIYQIVLDAQTYTASQIIPGKTSLSELDGFTISYFRKFGVEGNFTHGVTHFVAQEVHAGGNSSGPLEDGAVFTLEPGLYFPSESLGVRIEDMFTVWKGKLYRLVDGVSSNINHMEGN